MTWRQAFREQAIACEALGSPFTATLFDQIVARGLPEGPVRDRIKGWAGDISHRGDSVPLRLAGALHGLVLEGRAPQLATVYPPHPANGDQIWRAACETIRTEADWINRRLDHAPQTNETGRSAFLIAAGLWLQKATGLPLVLSELGASAGLNLLFDRYELKAGGQTFGPDDPVLTLQPDWRGETPERGEIRVIARAGADLAPADPVTDRNRLLSFIWPDQTERLARMSAALGEAARVDPGVERADAADFLDRRTSAPHPGAVHMVFNTVAWQYFPIGVQDRATAILQKAGAIANWGAPLAHVAMESDGAGPGASLRLTLWPDGTCHEVGRADFHGRWIDWRPPSL